MQKEAKKAKRKKLKKKKVKTKVPHGSNSTKQTLMSLLQPHLNNKNPTFFCFQPTLSRDPKIKFVLPGNRSEKFFRMNRGVLQSSPVQQMVAGNPNWWSMNNMRPPPPVASPLPSSSLIPQYPTPTSLPLTSWLENQELPDSWSQLLMGGLMGEEERCSYNNYQVKKVENWEDQILIQSHNPQMVDVKQENSGAGFIYPQNSEEFRGSRSSWSRILPVSSPTSSVTSFSSNILDFSCNKQEGCQKQADHSTECNSTSTGAAFKKARVQPSSAQSTFKVRKEKLGDRITALHQLVSPFGKTDTASVLLEAIGYIRFLQSQIEALSLPYMGSESGNMRQSVQGERNCIFPEDPGQLLNESGMKRRGATDKEVEDEPKRDLRSRGLCLVPVSCTLQVGSDNGADYWAPSLGGGFR